jgi:hypothetical protein
VARRALQPEQRVRPVQRRGAPQATLLVCLHALQ